MSDDKLLYCSFCGKNQHEVKKLIAGPNVYVCDECVELCNEIIREELQEEVAKGNVEGMTPLDIVRFLDDYVVGQSKGKISLAVAYLEHRKVVNHNKAVKEGETELDKQNIIMYGPTGSGKTLLVERLAQLFSVPYIKYDASNLTASGYVGDSVKDPIAMLLEKAGGDVEKAQNGIIFLDEFDKKLITRDGGHNSSGVDVSGKGAQQGLIAMIEGARVMIPVAPQKEVAVDTTNILFVLGGSFAGGIGDTNLLAESVRNRIRKTKGPVQSMGFTGGGDEDASGDRMTAEEIDALSLNTLLAQVEPTDLVNVGLIPELVGRCPRRVGVLELTKDQLYAVLTSVKNCQIDQYKTRFKLEGIDLTFDEAALNAIVERASSSTGARALEEVMIEKLTDYQYLIHTPEFADVCGINVTADFITGKAPEPGLIRGDRSFTTVGDGDGKASEKAEERWNGKPDKK